MEMVKPYTLHIDREFSEEDLSEGLYLVIIHATRIPPHIGIIADKHYHSLTIKGQEVNIPVEALIRNNSQRKIPSLFVKIKQHPAFSDLLLKEHFVSNVKQFPKVAVNVATCLSPVKLFFEELYGLPAKEINYLFELLPRLETKGLIENVFSMFIESDQLQLPLYDMNELNSGIDKADKDAQALGRSLKMQ